MVVREGEMGETHVCSTCDHDAVVVRPRAPVCLLARGVGSHVHAVVDRAVVFEQRAAVHPVVGSLGPLSVGVVPCEQG